MPRPSRPTEGLRAYNKARKKKETHKQPPTENEIQAFEILDSDDENSEDDCLIVEIEDDESSARAMKKL
jgi:hypothetical protein